MGCNCGQNKTQQYSYVYTSPAGETKTYKSEIEARAAQVRNRGGSYTTVAK